MNMKANLIGIKKVMITFSIIIPVYNAAHTIRRCVESIENNTFKDIELILIEDGSKDNSALICKQLSAEYDNITVLINNQNMGVSYTRNRGLEVACGNYTMFVDSDDWIETDYYETFNQVIEQYGKAFYICGFVNHDEKYNKRTEEFLWSCNKENERTVIAEDLKSNLQSICEDSLLQQLWNKVFLTDVIKNCNVRFDETISIGEDFRFILDYLSCGQLEKVVFIYRTLYHYMRDQETSLMFHVGYESVNESLANLKKLYELEGLSSEEIIAKIAKDKQTQIEKYAYLIMHNEGMKMGEKKRLILSLDEEQGKLLYKQNLCTYCKEKIAKII